MKVTRFEDLRCWQAARVFVKEVYMACEEGKLARDFETRAQFKKAGLGSMNNIAEGFGRFGTADALRFYGYAKSSLMEAQSMLYVFEDVNYLSMERIKSLREKSEETKAQTLGFISYLSR